MPVDVTSSKLLSSLPGLLKALGGQNVAQTPNTPQPLVPGQIVTATVAQLAGADRLIATINGQNYELKLPTATTAGQTLELEVVSTEPEPSFRLLNAGVSSQGKETNVTLSDSARLIQSVNISNKESLPARLRADPVPLAQEAPTEAAKLADNLKSAIGKSGFFYESHQALWVNGNYSLEALRQEPQASPSSNQSTSGNNPANTAPRLEQANQQLPDNMNKGSMQTLSATFNQNSATLVEHQIAALAGAPIEWQGQAWPGQPVQVSIQRDKDPQAFEDPTQKGWQSKLSLELPRLGAVDATMHLSAAGVRITIDAADEVSVDALRAATTELVDTLGAIGIKVLGVGLSHGG